ncbi:MFS transporter [Bordetella bronchiseptica]|uniref:Membrane protein n=5 Tax=Bordetella TaxID=517 RepID=A0A0H3LGF3_BORBR|nr:MFS transporter [Bordetella bronchiseptica]KAK68751.1 transporter, major facilitator family protein [Bordetella bronchiseptica 980-2]AMG86732.2 MFS transporter [Bordetella bronchiseptica]AWP73041.1 MFS transporter [Bordetella bronchiseptica]AWP77851.1 MFS transporter [Bordetella bronchiseptica]AWP82671.1 MFS transporter [Bordetella bronchiseptica]
MSAPPTQDPEITTTTQESPHSRRDLLRAMAGVSATVVLVAFDSTIVTTTLPRVAAALNGMALYAWVGTAYLLATAASILIFGRLGDMYGRKPLMLVSVSLVALGSIACGLAQSMPQLIAFRTLQGIGGGMMIATAFAAPADLFPDAGQRVRWMALVSATFAMASGIGPVLGGAATQALGWRAAFFISPLAAVAALFLLARYFPRIRPAQTASRRIDWVGGLLLIVVVGAPLAAIELAFAPGDGAHPRVALALAVAGIAAVALLVPIERRVRSPIFPLRVLAGLEPRLLNLAAVAVGATMFILIFYSPLLLQHELDYSPSEAGLLLTPLVAAISFGSIINGRLFPRQTEPQRLMVFGSCLLAAGSAMMLAVSAGTSAWWIVAAFFVNGTALGFLLPNLTLFMQMLSERRDVGVASALVQTTRAMGSAAGTALVGIAISHSSVLDGVRAGLILCVLLSLFSAVVAHRVKMKNVAATPAA